MLRVQASREARGLPSVGMGCCRSAECVTSAVGSCKSKRGATRSPRGGAIKLRQLRHHDELGSRRAYPCTHLSNTLPFEVRYTADSHRHGRAQAPTVSSTAGARIVRDALPCSVTVTVSSQEVHICCGLLPYVS